MQYFLDEEPRAQPITFEISFEEIEKRENKRFLEQFWGNCI